MSQVLTLAGKPINWASPPKANAKVKWSRKTSGGKVVYGSFRTICHLEKMNRAAVKRFGQEIVVLQSAYNTTVSASAGTHDFDACLDIYIPGVAWSTQQRFFREQGFGCWWRKPPKFGHHIHGFTLPPAEGVVVSDDFKVAGFKVGKYVDGGYSTAGRRITSSQIEDYYMRAFGLSGMHTPGSDRSWHPATALKGGVRSTIFNLDKFVAAERKKAAA